MKILFLENLPYKCHITVGSHHYARLFAEDNEVLWLSLPWHIAQLIRNRDNDRIKNWNRNRVSTDGNIHYLTPFTFLPYRNNPIIRSAFICKHQYFFIPGVRRILEQHHFLEPDIVWFSDPRHISLLKHLRPKHIVYRCVDNLEEFRDVPPSLLQIEKELIRRCDAVFFTSPLLKVKFSEINPYSYHLPNACDFDFFSNSSSPCSRTDLFKEKKLNVIYTGAIAEWMDFEALDIISSCEFVNLIMVGPIRTAIPDKLKTRKTITFTGPLPYKEMPGLIHHADIGVIPFKINQVTDYVDPIKLHEYCAGGLPCITSNFKTVREMNGAFYRYKDYDELKELLARLNQNRFFQYSKEQICEFAMSNSWKNRIAFVKSVIKV